METQINVEKRKRLVRLIAFLSTIILSSSAVMFVTFNDSAILLALILVPCVITLSISIIPVPVSARAILVWAIVCAIISIAAIVYAWVAHPETIRQYLH